MLGKVYVVDISELLTRPLQDLPGRNIPLLSTLSRALKLTLEKFIPGLFQLPHVELSLYGDPASGNCLQLRSNHTFPQSNLSTPYAVSTVTTFQKMRQLICSLLEFPK
jgi:hypothetical protein